MIINGYLQRFLQRKKQTHMSRASYWVFTLNNPSLDKLYQEPVEWFCFDWCIWSLEKASSGTFHLQGYAYSKARLRLTEIKKFAPTAHFEVRKGSHQDAKDYVIKQGTKHDDGTHVLGPWTFGSEPDAKPGKRNDLLGLKDSIHAGASMWEIAQNHFDAYLRYNNGITKYMNMYVASKGGRDWPTEVIVLIGPTGCGKSFAAKALDEAAFWKTRDVGQTNWWDGYQGQSTVVLDEYYGWLPWDFLLRLLDRYKFDLPIKGAFTSCLIKRIVITSNVHPDKWYSYDERKQYDALMRRITHLGVKPSSAKEDPEADWIWEKGGLALPKPSDLENSATGAADDTPMQLDEIDHSRKRGLARLNGLHSSSCPYINGKDDCYECCHGHALSREHCSILNPDCYCKK